MTTTGLWILPKLRKTLRVSPSSLENASGVSHRPHRPYDEDEDRSNQGGTLAARWGGI